MDINRLLNPLEAVQRCDGAAMKEYCTALTSRTAMPHDVQLMQPYFAHKRTHDWDNAAPRPQRPRVSTPLSNITPTIGETPPSSPWVGSVLLSSSYHGWRTAFFDVGFDANSIFNQICPLRKGRWRKEEEAYAIELVKMVHANRLPLKFRQSLRTFLAQKIHSDEMRVLKKVGNSKSFSFARQRRTKSSETRVPDGYENERSIEPLETLRRAFLKSVQIEVTLAIRGLDANRCPSLAQHLSLPGAILRD